MPKLKGLFVMRCLTTLQSIVGAMTLSAIAFTTPATATVFQTGGRSSESNGTMLLASAPYSPLVASMTAPETGDELTAAILPSADLPKRNLMAKQIATRELTTEKIDAAPRAKADPWAERQQRAGFTLSGLFRSEGNPSLATFFVTMAVIGIAVAGVRLEILRRRSEQDAFYGSELVKHRRRHRQRSTVIYVQTERSPSRSSQSHRRRRRSSSHNTGQRSRRGSHRNYDSTHPVTIEGRLAT